MMWNSEAEARNEIKDMVARYYHEFKENKKEYTDGERITYAARVFDEKEMYHAPVYPPNWQEPPRPQVTRTAPRRRTQHHEINRNA